MSDAAQKIEHARQVYAAAIGTDLEPIAKAQLQTCIRESRIARGILPDCGSAPDPRTLFDCIDSAIFVQTMEDSIRTTLATALQVRGLAFDATTFDELVRELARNTSQAVLSLEATS